MTPTPGVLDEAELRAVAERFGVSDDQVRRDHLISHVLAAIGGVDGVLFYGGTALTRTALPDLRLSEDIDLIALGPRSRVVTDLVAAINRGLARSFGEVRWLPPLERTRDAEPVVLEVRARLGVRLQLVSHEGQHVLPATQRVIEQRYSDAPSVSLQTLTDDGFVAAKISAWLDRNAPRDLFDLHAMARAGLLSQAGIETVRATTNWTQFPQSVRWPVPPTDGDWQLQLAHQTRLTISSHAAHRVVVEALTRSAPSAQPEHKKPRL